MTQQSTVAHISVAPHSHKAIPLSGKSQTYTIQVGESTLLIAAIHIHGAWTVTLSPKVDSPQKIVLNGDDLRWIGQKSFPNSLFGKGVAVRHVCICLRGNSFIVVNAHADKSIEIIQVKSHAKTESDNRSILPKISALFKNRALTQSSV